MKKLILSMAVLCAIVTTSCKKEYECSCTTTSKTTYSTVPGGAADASDIAILQAFADSEAAEFPSTSSTVSVSDKTSKANANATCTDDVNTETEIVPDTYNFDSDGQTFDEPAYKSTTVNTTDCSSSKK